MLKKYVSLFLLVLLLFNACEEPIKDDTVKYDFNIWVLNEGLWNMNNSSITGYHSETKKLSSDFFMQENGRGLGDVANDMIIYGSKAYVAVSVSSLIEVFNVYTGKSIRQIPLKNEQGVNRQVRCLASHNAKVYACCFDGTLLKIDSNTLTVEDIVKAGENPDGICVVNNKLYVSNSGGLNFPNYDSTVSVFDINSFKEIKKIKVAINPRLMKANNKGDLFVLSQGNYTDVPPRLQKINTKEDVLVKTYDFHASYFDVYNEFLYFYYIDNANSSFHLQVFNWQTETMHSNSFIKDNINIKTPYALNINPKDGSIFIADALDYQTKGDVYCLDKNGKLKYGFEANICPKKILFLE